MTMDPPGWVCLIISSKGSKARSQSWVQTNPGMDDSR